MADMEASILGNAGDTEIDLYADFAENELEPGTGDDYTIHSEQIPQDADLYDDVITTQSSETDFTDIGGATNLNMTKVDHSNESSSSSLSNSHAGKRVSLYVGQLTWWTTDTDLVDAIHELGIIDLLEVKFHENRVNGQSKGFAVVTVGSDVSSRTIMEKLPKREIHGQTPHILPCNKQSLSFFEGITRKDEPVSSIGAPGLHPMMRPPMGLPLSMPPNGSMDGSYRFSPQGPVLLRGAPPGGMVRPPMQMALGPRGPVSGGPMVIGRMSGPPSQQHVLIMQQPQRPGLPPNINGPSLMRQPFRASTPGMPVSSSSMPVIPGQHPASYYTGQPVTSQGVPPHGLVVPGQPHADPYYRGMDAPTNVVPISETEFQEFMDRNKTVSSSAINRAVQDASAGDFASAIETLVTAISLIRQSKIANDDRCKVLISSLQDTLKGIEDKSYGARNNPRSRSGSPRESRKKRRHRSRSRSPRDRNEYRRSEDYDGKYNRDHRRR